MARGQRRRDVGALERVGAEVEQLRDPHRHERLSPDLEGARNALLHEHDLPVVEAKREQVAVVGEIHHPLSRTPLDLAREAPFRGEKNTNREGAFRVPEVIRRPERIPPLVFMCGPLSVV